MSTQSFGSGQGPSENAIPVCPRHPDTPSYVSCQRCGRPACTRCQVPASVGFQCVDCVAQEQRNAPPVRSRAGFTVGSIAGRPVVTIGIIAVCVVSWLIEKSSAAFTNDYDLVPLLVKKEPWRLITSGFLHSPTTISHLLFNMIALYSVGQILEPFLGRVRFACLFLLSVLGGSIGDMLLTSPPKNLGQVLTSGWASSGWATPVLGASGGIFGLFLALVLLARTMNLALQPLLINIAINAALPIFIPNVAWQAHVGGAVVGALATGVILALRKRPIAQQLIALAGIAVILIAIAYTTYSMADLGWAQRYL